MAPEQLTGDLAKINERTDIFALGAILYELLSGKMPFYTDEIQAVNVKSVRYQSLFKAIETGSGNPRNLNSSIPKPLAAICEKALAFDPARRYETAGKLRNDVEKWLADELVSAYRENLVERTLRWARKNRGKAAAGVATLILGPLSVAAISRQLQVNARQKAEADLRIEKAERQAAEDMAKAETLKRFADLKTALETAKTRGAWREVIEAAKNIESLVDQEKLELSTAESLALKLDKLEAFDDGSQTKQAQEQARSLFDELKSQPDSFDKRARGRLYFRMGELFREDFRPGELSYFDLAQREELSAAERTYLRALAEPDPKKAVELLDESLMLNPFNVRAFIMSSLLNLWISEPKQAVRMLDVGKSIQPEAETLYLMSAMFERLVDKPMSEANRRKIEEAYGPRAVAVTKRIGDLLSAQPEFGMNQLKILPGLFFQSFLQLFDVFSVKKEAPLDFMFRNPPVAFESVSLFLGNIMNSLPNLPAIDGSGALMDLGQNFLLRTLRRRYGVPDKDAKRRIADYRTVLRLNPTRETTFFAAMELLRAGQTAEGIELLGNFPERSIINDRYYPPWIPIAITVERISKPWAEKLTQGRSPIGPEGPVTEPVRTSSRKMLRNLFHEKKPLDDLSCEAISALASMIEDHELAVLILAVQMKLEPTPRKSELLLFHKAMSDPRLAADYLTAPGVTKGDAWSWLLMKTLREHPEVARENPKLSGMPENPFMPIFHGQPMPLLTPLSTDSK